MNAQVKKTNQALPVECVWGLLCSLSAIDQERNNISLFNIIDQINIQKEFFEVDSEAKPFPFAHELVTLWRRTIDTSIDERELLVDAEIALIDPQGVSIQSVLTPLKFATGSRRARFRIKTDGIQLTTPGDYVYRISIVPPDGNISTLVLSIPLEVKKK